MPRVDEGMEGDIDLISGPMMGEEAMATVSEDDILAGSTGDSGRTSPSKDIDLHSSFGTHSHLPQQGQSRIAVVLQSSSHKLTLQHPAQLVSDEMDEDRPASSDLGVHRKRKQATLEEDAPVTPLSGLSGLSGLASETEDHEFVEEATAAPTLVPRKRGRPKGSTKLKKLVDSADPSILTSKKMLRQDRQKVVVPNTVPISSAFPKRRGRPPKQPSPPPRAIYETRNPRYVPFLCEWKECKAELQNMDFLRKHVTVVHGKQHDLTCQWARCATRQPARRFPSRDELEDHMVHEHLVPFSWHIGDGFRNDSPSAPPKDPDKLPPYLFDEHGKQVTPSVRDQELEDIHTWKANRRRLRDLLLQRDANLPDEEVPPGECV